MNRPLISTLAITLGLGLITPAEAEDWTGLHLTFGLSGAEIDMRDTQTWGSPKGLSGRDVAPYVALGYDWAFDSYTLGVIADVDLTSVDTADFITSGKGTYANTDWFATVRGRVGVPVSSQAQVFASGGVALLRTGATAYDLVGDSVEASAQTLKGRVVGVGMEYVLSPGRNLTVEYLYGDFERSDPYFDDGALVNGTSNPIINTLRIGYTLRF